MSLFFCFSAVVTGAIVAGLSIPLILGKVAPNDLYGIRTEKTMRSPEAWYAGNAFGGKALLIAGITTIIIGALIPIATESLGLRNGTLQLIGVAAELGPLVVAVVVLLVYVRKL